MDTAAIGVAQKEDEEQGIHQQDIFYWMVFFLAALTRGLFSRVLGADDASFGAVMGKRGDAGPAGWSDAAGRWFLCQRGTHRCCVCLRDAEALRQGRQGVRGGITKDT